MGALWSLVTIRSGQASNCHAWNRLLAAALLVGPERPLAPDTEPGPARRAGTQTFVAPVAQHSVAFAGKLAVWCEGDRVQWAIRGRFFGAGHSFTIAPRLNLYHEHPRRSATRPRAPMTWQTKGVASYGDEMDDQAGEVRRIARRRRR